MTDRDAGLIDMIDQLLAGLPEGRSLVPATEFQNALLDVRNAITERPGPKSTPRMKAAPTVRLDEGFSAVEPADLFDLGIFDEGTGDPADFEVPTAVVSVPVDPEATGAPRTAPDDDEWPDPDPTSGPGPDVGERAGDFDDLSCDLDPALIDQALTDTELLAERGRAEDWADAGPAEVVAGPDTEPSWIDDDDDVDRALVVGPPTQADAPRRPTSGLAPEGVHMLIRVEAIGRGSYKIVVGKCGTEARRRKSEGLGNFTGWDSKVTCPECRRTYETSVEAPTDLATARRSAGPPAEHRAAA